MFQKGHGTTAVPWPGAANGKGQTMKRLTGAVVLLLAASTFARDKGNKIVEVKYDQFKDRTTVSVAGKVPNYERHKPLGVQDVKLALLYSCPGNRTDCHPKVVGILLTHIAGLQWRLIHVDRIIFLADGKRIELQDVNWDGNAATGVEGLSGIIAPDKLVELASAEEVSLQAGPIERNLPEKARRGWRELADLVR